MMKLRSIFFVLLISTIDITAQNDLSVKSNEDGFSVMAGICYNNWNSEYESLLSKNYSSGFGFQLNAAYGFLQKFNVYAEFQFNKQNASGNYVTTNTAKKINLGFQYFFNGTLNKIRPFLGAGININTSTFDLIDIYFYIDTDNDGNVEEYNGDYVLSGVGLNTRAGIQYFIKPNLGMQFQVSGNFGNYKSNTLNEFDLKTEVDYSEYQGTVSFFYHF
ncbi:MAG: hypothetical protein HOP11_08420 [Saprospiraceae bacterium]|nr:hypothetical protein [Saprospiraceae bacterium]